MDATQPADVRHMVVEHIEALDGEEKELAGLAAEAARRREELRRRLGEVEGGWERVIRGLSTDPEATSDAFAALAGVRAELAGLDERYQALVVRRADVAAELESFRAVLNTLEDIGATSGSADGDLVNLQRASRELFHGIEDQRRRLARDLREGPARATAAMVGQAEALERSLRFSRYVSPPELAEIEAAVRATITETRDLLDRLDPVAPDDLGIVSSLRRLVREFADRSGVAADLRADAAELPLSEQQGSALFRIVQEALDNVERHAEASRVEVVADARSRGVRVTVIDDGCGFDAIDEEGVDRTQSFGLDTMRQRAAAVGASLQVLSRLGRGTEVRVTFLA